VHDAVYGDGYLGGQDPAAYVSYLRGQGVEAVEYQAARGRDLVANAKAELALGNPVLLTIPGSGLAAIPGATWWRTPAAHMRWWRETVAAGGSPA
jgi:hypothetical protein